jgi:hypothetical protein
VAERLCRRLIGSIRRECLDPTIVFGEAYLRRLPIPYASYYKQSERIARSRKTRRSHRPIERIGI